MNLQEITKSFEEKINKLFEFTSGKTVAIWGYRLSKIYCGAKTFSCCKKNSD